MLLIVGNESKEQESQSSLEMRLQDESFDSSARMLKDRLIHSNPIVSLHE